MTASAQRVARHFLAREQGPELPSGFLEGSVYKDFLYHGTNRKPKIGFSLQPQHGRDYGIYLATSHRYARMYGSHLARVFARIRHPLIVGGRDELPFAQSRDLTSQDAIKIRAMGYDAIINTGSKSNIKHADEIIVFDPKQVYVWSIA